MLGRNNVCSWYKNKYVQIFNTVQLFAKYSYSLTNGFGSKSEMSKLNNVYITCYTHIYAILLTSLIVNWGSNATTAIKFNYTLM